MAGRRFTLRVSLGAMSAWPDRETRAGRGGRSDGVQLTWRQMLAFIWERFDTYRNQKTDVQQWDYAGKRLRAMANKTREPEAFVREALRAISITEAGHEAAYKN